MLSCSTQERDCKGLGQRRTSLTLPPSRFSARIEPAEILLESPLTLLKFYEDARTILVLKHLNAVRLQAGSSRRKKGE